MLCRINTCMTHRPTLPDEICEQAAGLTRVPVTLRILEVFRNERAPVQGLAEIIATDQLLAVRVLKLANFATGLPQRLLTVSQAISVMGLDTLKALALGITVFPLEAAPVETDHLDPKNPALNSLQIWEHSVGCATVSARIAAQLDYISPHQTFASGFLHDMGRLLLYRCAREDFGAAIDVAAAKGIPLSEAETLALGINHVTLGEIWAGWNELPRGIQQVIRYHHEPPSTLLEPMETEIRTMIAIVQLADLLCESRAIGGGGDPGIVPEELWATLRLRKEGWSNQLGSIKREIEAAREVFGFPKQNTKTTQSMPRPKQAGKPIHKRQKTNVDGARGQIIPFPARKRGKPETRKRPSTRKLTILVVEDHGSLCEMLSLYLMRCGYNVRSADNGESALEILAKEEIHLVLLDLMLPRLDGFAVLEQLREKPKRSTFYIIVVSAGASERDRNKVLELGANEYMPKPFHLNRLLERIHAVQRYLL
jgi:CheY-like chemotaxis protein/HD-like signal output (HDOD) protein